MATLFGPRICIITGKFLGLYLALCLLAAAAHAEIVQAENYDAFWLWAGVSPQPALGNAKEIYLLAGEIRGQKTPQIISQRGATPHLNGPTIWVVYRVQTLAWNDDVLHEVLAHVETWRTAGNNISGLQIDFDAKTKHLDQYAAFLSKLRARLPQQYRLSVTGLLDWSANGDPKDLDALAGVVDEVVLQIYQGRHVIPGYARYFTKVGRLKVPFKIGLLQGGEWTTPAGVETHAMFKGYVVFLVNP